MRRLSNAELKAQGAPVEMLIEMANGGPCWSPEDIKLYKSAYALKHQKSRSLLGRIATMLLNPMSHDCWWMTFIDESGNHQNGNLTGEVKAPDFVVGRMRAIKDVCPEAMFRVWVYGTDPILTVYVIDEYGVFQVFYPLVWDTDARGNAFIVPVPQYL